MAGFFDTIINLGNAYINYQNKKEVEKISREILQDIRRVQIEREEEAFTRSAANPWKHDNVQPGNGRNTTPQFHQVSNINPNPFNPFKVEDTWDNPFKVEEKWDNPFKLD